MVTVAAVPRTRERDVLVLVVAYPFAAALGAHEVLRRAADKALLLFPLSSFQFYISHSDDKIAVLRETVVVRYDFHPICLRLREK